MIQLQNISKTYVQKGRIIKAVDNVNLEIGDGEIYGIVGFSGAGKSTLVRTINLLEKPDPEGTVIVDNVALTSLNEKSLRQHRSNIGMIFQHFNLMPSRTVIQNVLYPLAYKGIKASDQIKKAKELIDIVGLTDRLNNYPSELSGGQKQRVAIARALALSPSVLLCDEATSALDPKSTYEIIELIKKLNHDLNLTVVTITHEMDVVKELCTKVAVMDKGKVVEKGDVFDIFSNPKSNITKEFLKSTSNLSKTDSLKEQYKHILNLEREDHLVKLTYIGKGVSEPIISTLSQKYSISINIILADVSFIKNTPIGGTVCVIKGKEENIKQALASLNLQNIKVEILEHE